MRPGDDYFRREVLKDDFSKKVNQTINSLKNYIMTGFVISLVSMGGFLMWDLISDLENNSKEQIAKNIKTSLRKMLLGKALNIAKGEDDFSIKEKEEFAKYLGYKDDKKPESSEYKLFNFRLDDKDCVEIKGYRRNAEGKMEVVPYAIGGTNLVSKLGDYIVGDKKEKEQPAQTPQAKQTPEAEQTQQSQKIVEGEIAKNFGTSSRKHLLERALNIAKGEDDFSIKEKEEFAKYLGYKDDKKPESSEYKLFNFRLDDKDCVEIKGYRRNAKGKMEEVPYAIGGMNLITKLGDYIIRDKKEKEQTTQTLQVEQTPQVEQAQQSPKIVEGKNE